MQLRERLVGALMAATPDNVGESRVQRIVDDVWPVIEGLLWSNVTHGGHRLTWQELAERQRADLATAQALVTILQDLDRCEHGRHEGDECYGCRDQHGSRLSRGNELLAANGHPHHGLAQREARRIGTGIHGGAIVVPEYGVDSRKPEAWRR